MRYLTAMMILAAMAFAGADMGLGVTIMTEAESTADYGWNGSVAAGYDLLGVDWGTRLMGTVYYPEHSRHIAITGTVLGTGLVMLDSEAGFELGGGIQYGNEYARAEFEDTYLPVFYYGMDFALESGHHVKPFAMFTIEAERKTVQAGFLLTFGR